MTWYLYDKKMWYTIIYHPKCNPIWDILWSILIFYRDEHPYFSDAVDMFWIHVLRSCLIQIHGGSWSFNDIKIYQVTWCSMSIPIAFDPHAFLHSSSAQLLGPTRWTELLGPYPHRWPVDSLARILLGRNWWIQLLRAFYVLNVGLLDGLLGWWHY